jgi:hypothetical protein
MNALEDIERQLRVSVSARSGQTDVSSVDDHSPRRHQSPRLVAPLGSLRRVIQLAAVAAVIAAVIATVALIPLGSTSGPTPAVAAALRQLAQIAANGPSLVPAPGQYLYTRSEGRDAAFGGDGSGPAKECITYSTGQRRLWVGANGSGLLREQSGPNSFTSARDRAVCASMRMTRASGAGTSNLWFAADCFQLGPARNMSALSTDPRTLLGQMRRLDGGPRDAAEDFVHIGDFLRETDASPALRAALYRAAALIPGIQLLGTVRDHIGRSGLGVALEHDHVRNELIFNHQTAALMAEQSTGNSPGSNTWTVYLKSAVVNSIPYPSPVTLTPPCHNGLGYMNSVAGGTAMTGRRLK